jgi:hypothetical protein
MAEEEFKPDPTDVKASVLLRMCRAGHSWTVSQSQKNHMLLFLSLSQSLHKAAFPWQPESSSSHA